MTNNQIFDVMRRIILLVTTVPKCILSDPNAPSPAGAYASVQPKQTVNPIGQAIINRTTVPNQNSITVDVRAQIIAQCSINFYRGEALDFAQRLIQCSKRPDVLAILFNAQLGWQRVGPVNNLVALQSDNWESRAQVSVFLTYETSDPVVINSIEHVDWSVEDEKARVIASGSVRTPDAP